MNVCHLIESLDAGGAERALVDLIRFRPDADTRHHIVCLAEEGVLAAEAREAGATLEALGKKPGFDMKLPRRLETAVESWDPDLVHTHLFTGNLWGRLSARRRGWPLVMSVQNIDSWIGGWRALAERWLVNVARVTICVSESARDERLKFGLDPRRCRVIPNGSSRSPAPEKREVRRALWGVPDGAFLVGNLARCVEQKDPGLFVDIARAARKIRPEMRFVWIGGGDQLDDWRRQGLEGIHFSGHDDDAMGALAACDVVLSTSRREGSPLALIEAMRSGLPVLASDVPGNRELVGEADPSLLYARGDAAVVTGRLTAWMDDAPACRKLGDRLREMVEKKYSAEMMASAYHEVYREIVSS